MVDTKQKYLDKFNEFYELKNGYKLSDDLSIRYFEELVTLVSEVCKPIKTDSSLEAKTLWKTK